MIFGGADIYDGKNSKVKPLYVAATIWGDSKLKVVIIQTMRYIEYSVGDPEVFDKMNIDLRIIQNNGWNPDGVWLAGKSSNMGLKPFTGFYHQKRIYEEIFLNTFKD